MTIDQKVAVARNLALLGVDVIDGGFPSASKNDLEALKIISKEIGNPSADGSAIGRHVPVISALSRAKKTDIDTAWEAVRAARRPRTTVFLSTSEIHMQHKLRKSRDEVVALASEMVAYARSIGFDDVCFAAEDATRSDKDFLCRVFTAAMKAGATVVSLADTVGCSLPSEIHNLVSYIRDHTPGVENIILSVHCHNDLGLAAANTLAGIEGGAREVDVTINGIGERAGNASFEEVVMAIKCRKELLGGVYTGINTKYIYQTSKMVENYTGLHLQPHKAIVGANAFCHESGLHQDGVLKYRGTYEFISREDIGMTDTNENGICLGKLSGRRGLRAQLLKLGYDVSGTELDEAFMKFKDLTAKKKHITDDDLERLVCSKTSLSQPMWSLGCLQVTHGTIGFSTAAIKLISSEGKEKIACSVGKGPIDAVYQAIDSIVKAPTKLECSNSALDGTHAISSTQVITSEGHNHISAYSSSEKANGLASIDISNGHTVSFINGNGEDSDFVVSSAQAYLKALNRTLTLKHGQS
ncbi:hypothetical protein HPP92_008749 [Vanilla planifolia]|uniref:2-isopropylmalate synthase n=1 Tax=Vanilla planifolia TaxID=51239 RepID=A0A835V420_VANPL|nr:hypothetical protein HPP92_008749 [Vanilla planifolia]